MHSCQRESTTSMETAMASISALAPASSSPAAVAWSTSRPRRSATSASMPRWWKRNAPAAAGLHHTPAGGSGACVSTASRFGPPDFQQAVVGAETADHLDADGQAARALLEQHLHRKRDAVLEHLEAAERKAAAQ